MRLDDQLLRRAKQAASEEGKTLTALIDESLRERLARSGSAASDQEISLPIFRGDGLLPGLPEEIILDNYRLADAMDKEP